MYRMYSLRTIQFSNKLVVPDSVLNVAVRGPSLSSDMCTNHKVSPASKCVKMFCSIQVFKNLVFHHNQGTEKLHLYQTREQSHPKILSGSLLHDTNKQNFLEACTYVNTVSRVTYGVAVFQMVVK